MGNLKAVLESVSQKLYAWRRKCATVALCLLACWIAYHAVFGDNGMMVYSQKRNEHRALDKEILELKQENERLAHDAKALKNDPKAIEKEAREQLRYARPGEVIYTLPQPTQRPSTVTAQKH
jgi:cell division protein FtsB